MADFNIQDPAKQEAIRRGSHEYVPGEGRHGTYKPKTYLHQEYPKVMDKTPEPKRKEFKGKPDADILFENAMREWDERKRDSIVKNAAEEERWLEEHRGEVIPIAAGQYPKTMDKTPEPLPKDFDDLEEYRTARSEWKQRIAASIVHDRGEEQLWIRSHEKKHGKRKKTA